MITRPLEYIERKPTKASSGAAPLLILIHGYGSNEMDLFSFASELPGEFHVVSLQAPHTMGYNSYAWYSINFDADQNKFSNLEEAKESIEAIEQFIADFIKNNAVNPEKVFLVGFSQGAILSYGISLNTDKVQYVVALSGYLNEDLVAEKITKKPADYFISHGTVDQVIPVEWARKAPVYLDAKKIKNSFKEYPVGHGVHPTNFYDFKTWIEERM